MELGAASAQGLELATNVRGRGLGHEDQHGPHP